MKIRYPGQNRLCEQRIHWGYEGRAVRKWKVRDKNLTVTVWMKRSTDLFFEELKVNISGELDGVAIAAIHDSLSSSTAQHWGAMITMVGLRGCQFCNVVFAALSEAYLNEYGIALFVVAGQDSLGVAKTRSRELSART